jgi:hypothetical protein
LIAREKISNSKEIALSVHSGNPKNEVLGSGLVDPRRMDAVDNAVSVTFDMYFQSHFYQPSTRFSPSEAHFETRVLAGEIFSLRKRGVSNNLT